MSSKTPHLRSSDFPSTGQSAECEAVALSETFGLPVPAFRSPHLPLIASRWGQDERGRRRSAAIPYSQPSWEDACNVSQNMVTRAHSKANRGKTQGVIVALLHSNNICPDPVWKLALTWVLLSIGRILMGVS